jgi:hypothetical protein
MLTLSHSPRMGPNVVQMRWQGAWGVELTLAHSQRKEEETGAPQFPLQG